MVGDTSREVDSQNVPKAPLVERAESPAGLHGQVPHFGAESKTGTTQVLCSCNVMDCDIDEHHIFLVRNFIQPLAISILLRISSSLPTPASVRQPRYKWRQPSQDSTSSTELPITDTDEELSALKLES